MIAIVTSPPVKHILPLVHNSRLPPNYQSHQHRHPNTNLCIQSSPLTIIISPLQALPKIAIKEINTGFVCHNPPFVLFIYLWFSKMSECNLFTSVLVNRLVTFYYKSDQPFICITFTYKIHFLCNIQRSLIVSTFIFNHISRGQNQIYLSNLQ